MFRWAALHAAHLSGGNGLKGFTLLVLLGAFVAVLFTNDGSVLVVTPIVWEMARSLRLTPAATLAYLFACGFVADAISTPLTISNLVNILNADYFDISFGAYARAMFVPSLFALAATLAVLLVYFRRHLPQRYDLTLLPAPADAVRDRRLFASGVAIIALIILTFLAGSSLRLPESIVVAAGALLLILVGRRSPVVNLRETFKDAPWHVIFFSLGMYVVVFGLRSAGVVDGLAAAWQPLSEASRAGMILAQGWASAALASVMNNLPATVTGMLVVEATTFPAEIQQWLVLANVIGSDIGPKLTPIGSLGTLLWLHELNRREVKVSWGQYLRIGIAITPPVLTAALLGLWLAGLWGI